MSWRDDANATIRGVHSLLPTDVSLADRVKAIDAAYPFGERAMHPYKIWLDARAKYLVQFGFVSRHKANAAGRLSRLSPLERAKAKYDAMRASTGGEPGSAA